MLRGNWRCASRWEIGLLCSLLVFADTTRWLNRPGMQERAADIVTRKFHILEDGQEIGTDVWFQRRTEETVVEYRGELSVRKPTRATYRYRYRIGSADGAPRELSVQVQSGNQVGRGEYLFAEKAAEARVTIGLRASQTRTMSVTPGYAVEFGSPLFNRLALEQLRLKVGESRTIDAVIIDRSSLVPRVLKQTYLYRGNEMIELHGHHYDTNHYGMLIGGGGKRSSYDLWTDEDYLPLILRRVQAGHVTTIRLAPPD